jgi:hypothetical protein
VSVSGPSSTRRIGHDFSARRSRTPHRVSGRLPPRSGFVPPSDLGEIPHAAVMFASPRQSTTLARPGSTSDVTATTLARPESTSDVTATTLARRLETPDVDASTFDCPAADSRCPSLDVRVSCRGSPGLHRRHSSVWSRTPQVARSTFDCPNLRKRSRRWSIQPQRCSDPARTSLAHSWPAQVTHVQLPP